ncbi:hypothetical protein L9F63_012863, partial [Diploptera punctata]
PRIDPLQLLKCLSVLLSPTGGINSKAEVQRLASLMTKFSKKLVSKCIYIQILKTTKTDLLDMFMGAGGWNLTNTWLYDAILAKNWPLIQELLELLLMCPVDVERLKINNCPKLIKTLSKDSTNENVKLLASKLVEQWLKIVKGEAEAARSQPALPSPTAMPAPPADTVVKQEPEFTEETSSTALATTAAAAVKPEVVEPKVETERLEEPTDPVEQLPVFKITLKDGKRVIAKVPDKVASQQEDSAEVTDTSDTSVKPSESVVIKEEVKKEVEEPLVKITEVPKPAPVKSKVKSENNVDAQKPPKDSVKKSSSKSEKDRRSSKDKSRDKDRKSKDRDKSRDSGKSKDKKSSSSVKETEKVVEISEKDKATLAKLIPPTITSKDAAPISDAKKPSVSEAKKLPEPTVTKKPSISIESRKLGEPGSRPKTVKTFNSKFRSTGLEEEAKPPPSRQGKKAVVPIVEKKTSPIQLPGTKPLSLKRPSPPKDLPTPPEKKVKPDGLAEKTGGIKLIPARPKPSILQESDMFMDALTASTKKEPRKRKRRISSSKDGPETKKDSPVPAAKEEENKEPTPPSSPQNNGEKSPPIIRPLLKFYQDTMETNEEEKEETSAVKESEKMEESQDSMESRTEDEGKKSPASTDGDTGTQVAEEQNRRSSNDDSSKEEENSNKEASGDETAGKFPRGVLIYHKTRKGPKKVVRWKQEKELETIRFFELDETERVNVTKNFMDMKQMERSNERQAFQLARKIAQDDVMEEKTVWQPLIPVDLPPSLVEYGARSQEKEVQYAREKVTLQAIYFSRVMIPDTPAEPDLEIHPTISAVIIPLDDVTGNPDSVNDFQNTPWPEPKPILIPQSPPPQFQQPQPMFSPMQNQQPMFQNHNNMPSAGGDWRTGDGKVGGPPMNMGMGMGMGGPEMNYNMMPDDMGPFPGQAFPMGGGGGGGPPPPLFPFRGGGGGSNKRDMRRGRGNMQMGPRGGPSNGPWFQNNGPHSWQSRGGGPGRGGGWAAPGSKGICKHFRTGFCKHGESCPYLHPGINGPMY